MQTNKPTNQTKSNNSKNKTKQKKKTLLPICILLIETLAESAMMLS